MIKIFINLLTSVRIIFAFIIFLLVSLESNYSIAFLLFFLAGITDYFDGFLARKYRASSDIGEILDPIADKILIIFILFALAVNLSSYLIGFMGSIIISREIWVSALRDYNARNNNVDATKVVYIAKMKTTIQLFTISVYLLGLALSNMLILIIGDIFLIISTLITTYTGYLYTVQSFAKKSTY
tara:strand:+ start:1704 stop:2255 length:552 start_codon:yes stop_codon:yes gene_type:complete